MKDYNFSKFSLASKLLENLLVVFIKLVAILGKIDDKEPTVTGSRDG